MDSTGTVYVSEHCLEEMGQGFLFQNHLSVYDSSGQFLKTLNNPLPMAKTILGMAVDKDDNLYVFDRHDNYVHIY